MTSKDSLENKEVESRVEISGEYSPEEAANMIKRGVQDAANDEVTVGYSWESDAVLEDFSPTEAKKYLGAIAGRDLAQPAEKEEDSHYWSQNVDQGEGTTATSLPNPEKLQSDGAIEGAIRYNDGLVSFKLELDVDYDIDSEEASHGTIGIEYADRFETEAESEFEKLREGIEHIEDVSRFLD